MDENIIYPTITSEDIEIQTKEFLDKGGQIEYLTNTLDRYYESRSVATNRIVD